MIEIRITLDNGLDVWLSMQSYPEEIGEAYASFSGALNEGRQIHDAKSAVASLLDYLRGITITGKGLKELVFLNRRIDGMPKQKLKDSKNYDITI